MRLIAPMALLFLLLSGCTSEGATAIPTATTPPTQTATTAPSSTQTPTPEVAPTATKTPPRPTPTWYSNGHGPKTECAPHPSMYPSEDQQRGHLEWSPDGSSLIFNWDVYNGSFWELPADGSSIRLAANPKPDTDKRTWFYLHADLSPDGQRLVYSTCEFEKGPERMPTTTWPFFPAELAVIDMDGGEPLRLTENSGADMFPSWSPDGSRIAYFGSEHTNYIATGASVYIMSINGPEDEPTPRHRARALKVPSPGGRPPAWSHDGRYLAVVGNAGRGGSGSVYVIDLEGDSTPPTGLKVGLTNVAPTWSPDGERLAFATNAGFLGSKITTVHIVNRDGTGRVDVPDPEKLIANDPGDPDDSEVIDPPRMEGLITHVVWHPDGTEILVAEMGEGTPLWTVSPDGQTLRDVYRPNDEDPLILEIFGVDWSPDGADIAIHAHIRPPTAGDSSNDQLIVATLPRQGGEWHILSPKAPTP